MNIPVLGAGKLAHFLSGWRSDSRQMWRARRRAIAWAYPEWKQKNGMVSKGRAKQFREDYGRAELDHIKSRWRAWMKQQGGIDERLRKAEKGNV